MRTHFCGLIDESLIGQTVTLCGWADVARDLGGLCFIDLRDHEGIVQIVAEPSDAEGNAAVIEAAAHVGYEDCLRITGVVRPRPEGTVNANLATGEIEIGDCEVETLRRATPPPFDSDADTLGVESPVAGAAGNDDAASRSCQRTPCPAISS